MNEFIFGFEVEFGGTSERFVSEEAYKAQQSLKTEYMSRDMTNMHTISELREQLVEKQGYIKVLEERIASQRAVNKNVEKQKLDAHLRCGIYEEDIRARDDEISILESHNVNQQKELARLNKTLERERKRNKELEELYSGAQKDVSMLNLKVMELNQGIRNSTDLSWKEKYDELEEKYNELKEKKPDYAKILNLPWKAKYDELETKYTEDSRALNGVINELRECLKNNDDQNNMTCKKLGDDLAYITDRCAKAEHTIDVIKEALIDGDYIRGIEQLSKRRNNK